MEYLQIKKIKQMNNEFKQNIDTLLEAYTSNEIQFKITVIALIKMMHDSGNCEGELKFYSKISEAIINKDESLSYEEKYNFLAMHKSLIEIYNDN